jgi:hypothetical protein
MRIGRANGPTLINIASSREAMSLPRVKRSITTSNERDGF